VIVLHGGMINMLFKSFLEFPVNGEISIKSGDTGIHHWRIDNGNKEIILCNNIEHLRSYN
jgi:2,3-bisphosphoglycerate-dependent phosphoglycerate mutase